MALDVLFAWMCAIARQAAGLNSIHSFCQSVGLLVARLCVLLIASPEGEMKNRVLGWAGSLLWVSPVC